MGYEGDTCSFTCNTGYELTGSDNRTCQSDGSWSGSESVCESTKLILLNVFVMSILTGVCLPLARPDNGVVGCSQNSCFFSCNFGYELTGSDTRTCQNDGSWSGMEAMCRRGMCTVFL